jgi:predicted DNA-binding protein
MNEKTQVKTRVSLEIKMKFQDLVKTKGKTEAEFLRSIIIATIGEVNHEDNHPEPTESNIELDRLTIRLPKFLMEATKERAKLKGMVKSRWIKSLVQSNIMNQPVMTDNEVLALRESNRELASIGRNLNQIARALNESFYKTESVKTETLNKLSQDIKENREAITALTKASKESWMTKN